MIIITNIFLHCNFVCIHLTLFIIFYKFLFSPLKIIRRRLSSSKLLISQFVLKTFWKEIFWLSILCWSNHTITTFFGTSFDLSNEKAIWRFLCYRPVDVPAVTYSKITEAFENIFWLAVFYYPFFELVFILVFLMDLIMTVVSFTQKLLIMVPNTWCLDFIR